MVAHVAVDPEKLGCFCRRHHIRRLALFGSVLSENFRPDSDVDVLVEFEPGSVPGFLARYDMEEELSVVLGGRKVDLVTPKSLNPLIRDQVVSQAQIQYAEG